MTERIDDEALRRLADSYNRPPEAPREAMWAAIETGLTERGGAPAEAEEGRNVLALPTRRPGRSAAGGARGRRGLTWSLGLAAAAVLLLGIGIGRWSAPPGQRSAAVDASGGAATATSGSAAYGPSDALRLATIDHLGRAEPLLTTIRVDARAGRVDGEVGDLGRRLLSETRLLLDTEEGLDPELRVLLQDLELILAQVALLSREGSMDEARGREELSLIAQGLDEQGVMTRIRAALPTGSALTNME